jgi:hypothetical protein
MAAYEIDKNNSECIKKIIILIKNIRTNILDIIKEHKILSSTNDTILAYVDSIQSGEKVKGEIVFSIHTCIIETFPFDLAPLEELNKIIIERYPLIAFNYIFYINYKLNIFNFEFGFDIHFDDDDVILTGDGFRLLNKTKNIDNVLKLFNNDLSIILRRKITNDDWQQLKEYMDFFGRFLNSSDFWKFGVIQIDFSSNKLE